jgi:hypothetical protein
MAPLTKAHLARLHVGSINIFLLQSIANSFWSNAAAAPKRQPLGEQEHAMNTPIETFMYFYIPLPSQFTFQLIAWSDY